MCMHMCMHMTCMQACSHISSEPTAFSGRVDSMISYLVKPNLVRIRSVRSSTCKWSAVSSQCKGQPGYSASTLHYSATSGRAY